MVFSEAAPKVFSRWTLISLAGVDVVLFVLANATLKSSSHPGTVSNAFWDVFLVGVVLLILLVVAALIRWQRAKTR